MTGYLDAFLAKSFSDERDITLGRFMHAWEKLEMQLGLLLHILMGTDINISLAIFSTGFQSPNLIELFKALGQIRLNESEQKELKSLCKRYSKAVGKRNKIVHGQWYLDSDATKWARIYFPISPIISKQISDKKNQKIRSTYRFTIQQLKISTDHIKTLANDIDKYMKQIIRRLNPE